MNVNIYLYSISVHDVLLQLGKHGSNLTEEELETHTIAAWKEGKLHLNREINGNARSYPQHLIDVCYCEILFDNTLV